MASQPRGRVFTRKEIADMEDVPSTYVQQLMTALRTAGLVASHRGKVGGFTLAKPADSITVADIVRATEGWVLPAPCLGYERCSREATCAARPVWKETARIVEDYLTGVTLSALIDGSPSVDARISALSQRVTNPAADDSGAIRPDQARLYE